MARPASASFALANLKLGKTPVSNHLTLLATQIPDGERDTRAESLARIIWAEALSGKEWAIKHILDRMEGRVKEVVEYQDVSPMEELTIEKLQEKAATLSKVLYRLRPSAARLE